MASIRNKLEVNTNDSKNTRMNITDAFAKFSIRKDEMMHIGRYFRAVSEIMELSKQLGRPLRVLELGCGECYIPQLFCAGFVTKKSDFISEYFGVDIDGPMLERTKELRGGTLKLVNGKLIRQDLTINPKVKLKSNSVDLIICFEMFEHIQPEFVEPIVKEIARLSNPEGKILLSTPNATGSMDKLPLDHVYEWGYVELQEVLEKHLNVVSTHGISINYTKLPKEEKKRLEPYIEMVHGAFGRNNAFSTTALGAFVTPEYAKNVLWMCNKEG